jgi:hypothetical protein
MLLHFYYSIKNEDYVQQNPQVIHFCSNAVQLKEDIGAFVLALCVAIGLNMLFTVSNSLNLLNRV